jgi:hypothetical protein
MKKILIAFVFMFALAACVAQPAVTPQSAFAQGLVALPDEAVTLILALVTAGVAWLLLKINMGQYTQALAAVFAPIIVTAIESFLQTIPPVFDNLVLSIIHILVLLVSGSLGTLILFRRAKTPSRLLEH